MLRQCVSASVYLWNSNQRASDQKETKHGKDVYILSMQSLYDVLKFKFNTPITRSSQYLV